MEINVITKREFELLMKDMYELIYSEIMNNLGKEIDKLRVRINDLETIDKIHKTPTKKINGNGK
jgi:hypothetical protein